MARLDLEIKTLKDNLLPYKESEEYRERTSNLIKTLDKEEKEQKIKKRKKYNRDFENYQASIVFEWQKKLAAEQAVHTDSRMEAITQGDDTLGATPSAIQHLPLTHQPQKNIQKTPKLYQI